MHDGLSIGWAENTRASFLQIPFPAINRSCEVERKLFLIVKIVCQPILQLPRFFAWELADVSFNGFQDWHGGRLTDGDRFANHKFAMRRQTSSTFERLLKALMRK